MRPEVRAQHRKFLALKELPDYADCRARQVLPEVRVLPEALESRELPAPPESVVFRAHLVCHLQFQAPPEVLAPPARKVLLVNLLWGLRGLQAPPLRVLAF